MRLFGKLFNTNKISMMAYNTLRSYTPPVWCRNLKLCPSHRVLLAQTPTPIHPWIIPDLPKGVKLHIKRDDMTGCVLSGNKIRKLEYLFGDAINNGYTSVITCGALQSNHCRATAVTASQLGLKTHLLLRTELDVSAVKSSGNLFLSQMCDAKLYLVPKRAKYETELKPRQEALAEEIFQRTGEKAYQIPVGGSNVIGLHGYLNAWEELIQQGVQEDFDDVVVTCGSGGSICGLAIGNYLTGSKVKIHGIAVCDDKKYFHGHINDTLQEIGLNDVSSEEIVDIIEGHKGAGYGFSTPEDHALYQHIASATGIFCDPVYTGKGTKGLLSELRNNRSRFNGDRVLFVHTGGIFGLYDGRMFEMFDGKSGNLFDWKNMERSASDFKF